MRFKNWLKGAKAKAFVFLGSFAMLLGLGASIYSVKATMENEVVETKAAASGTRRYFIRDQIGAASGADLYLSTNSTTVSDTTYKFASFGTVNGDTMYYVDAPTASTYKYIIRTESGSSSNVWNYTSAMSLSATSNQIFLYEWNDKIMKHSVTNAYPVLNYDGTSYNMTWNPTSTNWTYTIAATANKQMYVERNMNNQTLRMGYVSAKSGSVGGCTQGDSLGTQDGHTVYKLKTAAAKYTITVGPTNPYTYDDPTYDWGTSSSITSKAAIEVTYKGYFYKGSTVVHSNISLTPAVTGDNIVYSGETFTANAAEWTTYTYPTGTGISYTFQGWYTTSALSTPFTSKANVTSTFTIYAKFTDENNYTVTFNPKGGAFSSDGSTSNKEISVQCGNTVSAQTVQKVGYSFLRWSETDGGATAFDFATEITSAKTLYAVWGSAATYTIKIDAGPIADSWGTSAPKVYYWDAYTHNTDGGEAASDSGSDSVYGNIYQFNVPQNATGMVIANSGWTYKSQDISDFASHNGHTYVLTETTSTRHGDAYRCNGLWRSSTLTLTESGGDTTPTHAFYSGVAFNLPTPAGKSGYTATSWNSNSGGGGDSYTLGQSVTFTANTTLYVIYTQHGYYVVGDSTFTGGATPTWSELTGTRLSSATSGTDHAAGTSIRIPGLAEFRIKNYSTGAADQWCAWGDGGYPTDLFDKVGNNLKNKSSSEVIIDIYVNSSDKVYIVDETEIETAGYLYYSSSVAASSITLTATNGNDTTINGYLSNVSQLATAPSTLAFASSTYLYKIPVYNLRGVYTYAKVTSITINNVAVSLTSITQEDSKEYYIDGTNLNEDKGTAARIAWDLDASINDAKKTYQSLCALDPSTLTKFKSDYVGLTDSGAKTLLNNATINTYTPDGNSYDKTTGPKITTKANIRIEVIYNYVNAHYNASTGSWTLNIMGPAGQVESSPLTLTLWIVLGAGILGMGAIGTAYFVSKKKKKGDRAAS